MSKARAMLLSERRMRVAAMLYTQACEHGATRPMELEIAATQLQNAAFQFVSDVFAVDGCIPVKKGPEDGKPTQDKPAT